MPVTTGAGEEVHRQKMTLVRAPKYFRFMGAGAVVGVGLAAVLTVPFPHTPGFGVEQIFGFLLLVCVAIGLAAGGALAALVDSRATKRARTVIAEHEASTHPASLRHESLDRDPLRSESLGRE